MRRGNRYIVGTSYGTLQEEPLSKTSEATPPSLPLTPDEMVDPLLLG